MTRSEIKSILGLLLFLALWLLLCFTTHATIWNAPSCQNIDVQNTVNLGGDGDTVMVPGGFAIYTNSVIWRKNVSVIAAGTNQTIIVDEINRNNNTTAVLLPVVTTNSNVRISGFAFQGSTNAAFQGNPDTGIIQINGTCFGLRIDSCSFSNNFNKGVFINGWNYGVIDHCSFVLNFKLAIQVIFAFYKGGDVYGDSSWADAPMLGSQSVICIEDCFFNDFNSSASSANALDTFMGGRVVVRHCTFLNTAPATHGLDTSGRYRSFRTLEVYNCTLTGTNLGCVSAGSFRGGTGLWYSNAYTGAAWCSGGMGAVDYRAYYAAAHWGSANGFNVWDSNNPTIFYTGTENFVGLGSTNITDTNANWTPNQWVNYTVVDRITGYCSYVLSNTKTNIGFDGNGASLANNTGNLVPTLGNPFSITQPLITLDQPGRGQDDGIVDDAGNNPINSKTGVPGWPHQALEPIYCWSNTINGTLVGFGSSFPTVQANRDFYNNTPAPGYTPLVYPHPLVTAVVAGTSLLVPLGNAGQINSLH